jgi:hypothetical protein
MNATHGYGPTLVDCGCEAKVHSDGSGVEIEYCPMHAAARQMLEALAKWALYLDNYVLLERINRDDRPYDKEIDEDIASIREAIGDEQHEVWEAAETQTRAAIAAAQPIKFPPQGDGTLVLSA